MVFLTSFQSDLLIPYQVMTITGITCGGHDISFICIRYLLEYRLFVVSRSLLEGFPSFRVMAGDNGGALRVL